MHRSGTSAAMALLRAAGVHIGTRLHDHDRLGHSENLDFVELHQHALAMQGLSSAGWTTEREIHPPAADEARDAVARNAQPGPWGWKDPRTTLFLDFWHELLPHARFVFLYRAPWEVIDSLFRRRDFPFFWSPALALEIWIHYNARLLEFARRVPCSVTSIDSVAAHPEAWLASFGLRTSERVIARDRLHVRAPAPEEMAAISDEALDLYAELCACDSIAPGAPRIPPRAHGAPAEQVFRAWMESHR